MMNVVCDGVILTYNYWKRLSRNRKRKPVNRVVYFQDNRFVKDNFKVDYNKIQRLKEQLNA